MKILLHKDEVLSQNQLSQIDKLILTKMKR